MEKTLKEENEKLRQELDSIKNQVNTNPTVQQDKNYVSFLINIYFYNIKINVFINLTRFIMAKIY